MTTVPAANTPETFAPVQLAGPKVLAVQPHLDDEQETAGEAPGQEIGVPGYYYAKRPKTWLDKVEAFISGLSVRDNFWHRICSLIWLPYAFFSGIKMRKLDANTFSAILPFTRFNRNWYRAMAGGALLGNSEIAGGMYVFGICGADYTVVCKNLEYRFLRPCFGPAVYKMKPREDIHALLATRREFNLTLDMDILQQMTKTSVKDRRVGKCAVTFHVTPKDHHWAKDARRNAEFEI